MLHKSSVVSQPTVHTSSNPSTVHVSPFPLAPSFGWVFIVICVAIHCARVWMVLVTASCAWTCRAGDDAAAEVVAAARDIEERIARGSHEKLDLRTLDNNGLWVVHIERRALGSQKGKRQIYWCIT